MFILGICSDFWTQIAMQVYTMQSAAAMAQSFRTFAPQAEGWEGEFQPRQT